MSKHYINTLPDAAFLKPDLDFFVDRDDVLSSVSKKDRSDEDCDSAGEFAGDLRIPTVGLFDGSNGVSGCRAILFR